MTKKLLLASLLLTLFTGCGSFHVSHIPIIGWRIDIARQRTAMRKTLATQREMKDEQRRQEETE